MLKPVKRYEFEELKKEIYTNRKWDKLIVALSVISICISIIKVI